VPHANNAQRKIVPLIPAGLNEPPLIRKRRNLPLNPGEMNSASSGYSPSGSVMTPFRKRPSASEALLHCLETNQSYRMMGNEKKMKRYEEQQHLKEKRENWREQTKERHQSQALLSNGISKPSRCFQLAASGGQSEFKLHHHVFKQNALHLGFKF